MTDEIDVGKLVRENEILEIIGNHLTGEGYEATQVNTTLINIINEIKSTGTTKRLKE